VEMEGREDATVDIGSMEHKSECALNLTLIQNKLDELRIQLATPPQPKLEGEDRVKREGDLKAYNYRKKELESYRGLTYNVLFGQCTQGLKDKLKSDSAYDKVTKSGNPLRLKALIEKVVMAQTEHQYYAKTILDQEKLLLGFVQGTMSNAQYYEKMSNRINVDRSVGITRVHKVAVQAIANKQYSKKVEDLTAEELEMAKEAAEEGFIAYIMIMNSSTEHNKLKTSLADDYAKGQDTYPKNKQDALRLLDTFTRNAPPRVIESEGGGLCYNQEA
jgi:hypothetical protein